MSYFQNRMLPTEMPITTSRVNEALVVLDKDKDKENAIE
jgi:hypothetical protein